jgi:hypothetical protein
MSEQNVTIPAEVWKQTLIKVDIIKAEFERLKDEIIAHRNLKAENERLRYAGDNLYSLAKLLIYCLGDKEKDNPALNEWKQAKGVQS